MVFSSKMMLTLIMSLRKEVFNSQYLNNYIRNYWICQVPWNGPTRGPRAYAYCKGRFESSSPSTLESLQNKRRRNILLQPFEWWITMGASHGRPFQAKVLRCKGEVSKKFRSEIQTSPTDRIQFFSSFPNLESRIEQKPVPKQHQILR